MLLFLIALFAADSAAIDTMPRRVVRQLDPIEVRSHRDLRATQTVRTVTPTALRSLPLDRLADAVALEPGVVAVGGELHVRGGRAGDLSVVLEGVPLRDPMRGGPLELPLLAVREATLVSGGLEASHGGALAGVLALHTVDPGRTWAGESRWQTSAGIGHHVDRASARVGGPVPRTGLGVVASVEGHFDDTWMPTLRTNRGSTLLGQELGWRADNHLLGHLKVAPVGESPPIALQLIADRRIERPYDPMWSFDRYLAFAETSGVFQVRDTPAPGFTRFNAADHQVMTDTRSLAAVLSATRRLRAVEVTAATAWIRRREVTSLDGRDDARYITRERRPFWGAYEDSVSSPFLAYGGDVPYFRRATSDTWMLRADAARTLPGGVAWKAGAAATYEDLAFRQLDLPADAFGVPDTLRAFHAHAPGGFVYAQTHGTFEGLVIDAGLRAQYFTPGRGDGVADDGRVGGTWSIVPRFGFSYPMSDRDAISASYVRIDQAPPREMLYENRAQTLNRHPLGSPDLEPATVISYQAALLHLIDARRSVSLALFYRDLFGQVGTVDRDPRPHITQLAYASNGEGHVAGFEVSAVHQQGADATVALTYTWMDAWGRQSTEEGVPYGPRLNDRALPVGEHPLDWDRRHTVTLSALWPLPGHGSIAWSTVAGSGLPWTPRPRRAYEADQSRLNSRRLGWSETSSLALRWRVPRAGPTTAGLDVRNVFDWRGDVRSTLDGYPNPAINTLFDDDSAYRAETGQGGGAYWGDADGDGVPGWVPVHDPRLAAAPRSVRFVVARSF